MLSSFFPRFLLVSILVFSITPVKASSNAPYIVTSEEKLESPSYTEAALGTVSSLASFTSRVAVAALAGLGSFYMLKRFGKLAFAIGSVLSLVSGGMNVSLAATIVGIATMKFTRNELLSFVGMEDSYFFVVFSFLKDTGAFELAKTLVYDLLLAEASVL